MLHIGMALGGDGMHGTCILHKVEGHLSELANWKSSIPPALPASQMSSRDAIASAIVGVILLVLGAQMPRRRGTPTSCNLAYFVPSTSFTAAEKMRHFLSVEVVAIRACKNDSEGGATAIQP